MEADNFDSDSTPPSNPVQPAKHTKFLDLTNGEGGDGADSVTYADEYGAAAVASGNATGSSPASAAASGGGAETETTSQPGGDPNAKYDPSTPGRVVETGQEHTGRWTKEEHEAFLGALKMYGKEWKKVAAKVKTRTVVQTRTHAQKYFQKLSKATEESAADVEMRVAAEARKPSSQKKKPRTTPPPVKVSRTASLTSAAEVISSLHNSQQASLSPSNTAHGFQALSAAAAAEPAVAASSHGFSSAFAEPMPVFTKSTIGTSSFPMKIVAPGHDFAMKRGKFPEPSPAACGKRKLAEIAAARMLAGVAASELPAPPSGVKSASFAAGLADNVEDGTATPPPEEDVSTTEQLKLPPPPSTGNSMKATPEPPAMAQPKKPLGLSLQIVNPETLGISHEQIQKKRRDGNASPVTPWEGQLQALVRYVCSRRVVTGFYVLSRAHFLLCHPPLDNYA